MIGDAQRAQADAVRALGAAVGAEAFAQIQQMAVEAQRRQDESMRVVAPLQPLIDELKRQEEARRNLIGQMLGGTTAALVEQLVEPARTAARLSELVREQLLGPIQQWRDFDEKERRLCGILASRGWVISPSLPIASTHELLAIHDEHGVDALEAHLIERYADALARLLETTYNRESFTRRRHLFEQALDAHRGGNYALSVPTWLAQTDGIVFEELAIRRIFTSKSKKRWRQLREELGGEDGFGDNLLNGLLAVLEAAGASEATATTGSYAEVARRHLILHGLDLDYGTERNSIQGALVLELLHMYFESRDSRTRRAA